MLAVKNQVFIAVISGKIANIFMGRRNFFIYLYLPVSGTEPLDNVLIFMLSEMFSEETA
jgi:hypothetical protein